MGKLVCLLPHHLYRRVSRGEVGRRPLITSPPNVPTTYREEGLVGKLAGSTFPTTYGEEGSWGSCLRTSPPPIQMSVSWGSWQSDARWLHPLTTGLPHHL